MAEEPQAKSYPLVAIFMTYRGAITHKKEILTLYLQGYLTPTIAAKTRHSKEAVDRYIRDYESRLKLFVPQLRILTTISQITRLSKRVITQYLDLIPQHQLQTLNANLAKQEELT